MGTQKTELIRTSQSWNGAELPDFFFFLLSIEQIMCIFAA